MTPLELALTSLSEATAITLHQTRASLGFSALKRDATDAGATAGKAREVIEADIGQPVVSSENYLHVKKVRGQGKKPDRALLGKSPAENTQHQRDNEPIRQEYEQQPSLFNETDESQS